MRILFYASRPELPIGYSKVAHRIACWLAVQPGVELHYFAVGAGEDGCGDRGLPPTVHRIDVASEAADTFGMDILERVMSDLKPDVFLIYNDVIVTCRAFNALLAYRASRHGTRFISYIDLVYPYEKLELVRHLDRNTDAILVFSDCWRRNLVDMGVAVEKITVFPHGFCADVFQPMDAAVAKARFGFAADAFVILNANRNTYRKAQDIALRAFVEFLVRENWDPRIHMFIHCAISTASGYNMLDVLEVEACRARVPLANVQERIRTFPAGFAVSDMDMNWLYNAADVGLNTCVGEGFGLCQLEHAALGRPQIASRVGALTDMFGDGGAILVEPRAWIRASNTLDEHSGDLGICSAADFAAAMSMYFHDSARQERDGLWGAMILPKRYDWSCMFQQLKKSLLL